MDNDKLVPVYSTRDEGKAEVIRAALEGEGIPASVEGAHQGGFSGALKVRVFVRDVDEDRAREFIEAHESHEEET